MQTIKLKIGQKDRKQANNDFLESSIIKEIIPEIEFYRFEELTPEEVQPEYADFESFFEDFVDEKPKVRKKQEKKFDKPSFVAYFTISNLNKPIDINLEKVKKIEYEREELQKQVQEAYDKGFEDGQQATQMALTEEFNKLENWVRRIDKVTDELIKEFSNKIRELKNAIVPISIEVAEQILRAEVKIKPELVENQIAKALEIIDNEKIFNIRLNPDDIEILEKIQSNLLSHPKLEGVEIIPDPTISQGGCIIETEVGQIDATFQSQLNKIQTLLSNVITSVEEDDV